MPDEGEPTVPVVCEACGTETAVPLSEVTETVASHNDRLHDGTEEAGVDPTLADQLADVVAEDMGLLEE
ncbi:MAG: hypothetical protein J07HB67_01379 [halophilic archaeon J07HB67]|jgi:hypothetical protein|nr:MAG: hypothetical protein J07HB67_01379 [halophilic archaeon J07HB67]